MKNAAFQDCVSGRKVVVSITVPVEGQVCASGRVVAVRMPERLLPDAAG